MHHSKKLTLFLATILVGASFWFIDTQSSVVQAQPRITLTPNSVTIPTTAPSATPQPAGQSNNFEVSPSPTFTPTEPLPNVTMVSVAPQGGGIIRDFPETGANIGFLSTSETYQVTGQYFSWIQFQYAGTSSGRAWTFIQNVQLTGNLGEVPFIDPNNQPAQLSPEENATATAVALLQTPSVAETATAQARLINTEVANADSDAQGNQVLNPTYTPPADIVILRPTTAPNAQPTAIEEVNFIDNTIDSVTQGDVPPFLPIVGLAVFGIIGMLLSALIR